MMNEWMQKYNWLLKFQTSGFSLIFLYIHLIVGIGKYSYGRDLIFLMTIIHKIIVLCLLVIYGVLFNLGLMLD